MKRIHALILAGFLLMPSLAWAQLPVPFVNPQQLQIPNTGVDFNNLISSINKTLSPVVPTAAPAGTGIVLGTTTTNGSVSIVPNGTGNAIFFGGPGTNATGVIQIANPSGWYPAIGKGIVPCPGGGPGPNQAGTGGSGGGGQLQTPGVGQGQTVAGYAVFENWLGVAYWIPACR